MSSNSIDSGSTGIPGGAEPSKDMQTAGLPFDFGLGLLGSDNKREAIGKVRASDMLDPTFFAGNANVNPDGSSSTAADEPWLIVPDQAMVDQWIKEVLSLNKSGSQPDALAGGLGSLFGEPDSIDEGEVSLAATSASSQALDSSDIDKLASLLGLKASAADGASLTPNLWVSTSSSVFRIFMLLSELGPIRQEMMKEEVVALIKGMQSSLDLSLTIADKTKEIGELQVKEAAAQIGAAAAQIANGMMQIGGALGGAFGGYKAHKKEMKHIADQKADLTTKYAPPAAAAAPAAGPGLAPPPAAGAAAAAGTVGPAAPATPAAGGPAAPAAPAAGGPAAPAAAAPAPALSPKELAKRERDKMKAETDLEARTPSSMFASNAYGNVAQLSNGLAGGVGKSIEAAGQMGVQILFLYTKMAMALAEATKSMAEAAKGSQDQVNNSLRDDIKSLADASQTLASLLQAFISTAQSRSSQGPSGT
ncbi:MAG: hypothetical protein K0S07_76 [Chlamydiales bacterium]|jgi:hypothetical protein|nr:hypothetical protein [Chlamydiales bacterium]